MCFSYIFPFILIFPFFVGVFVIEDPVANF